MKEETLVEGEAKYASEVESTKKKKTKSKRGSQFGSDYGSRTSRVSLNFEGKCLKLCEEEEWDQLEDTALDELDM